MRDPFALLGLDQDAGPDDVKRAWRALVKEAHPDYGGEADEFDKLRKAYEEALAIAQEPKQCPACLGKGKISINRGLHTMSMDCHECGGTGVKA